MGEAHGIRAMGTRRVCGQGGLGALGEALLVNVQRLRGILMQGLILEGFCGEQCYQICPPKPSLLLAHGA